MGIYYFGLIFYGFCTTNTNFEEIIEILPSRDWIRKYVNGSIILSPSMGWSINPNLVKDETCDLYKSKIFEIIGKPDEDERIMECSLEDINKLHKIAKKLNISLKDVGLHYLSEMITTIDGIHSYINYIIPIK